MSPGTLPWLRRMIFEGEIFGLVVKPIRPHTSRLSDEPVNSPDPAAIVTEGVLVDEQEREQPC